jgi:hypothetical protein
MRGETGEKRKRREGRGQDREGDERGRSSDAIEE